MRFLLKFSASNGSCFVALPAEVPAGFCQAMLESSLSSLILLLHTGTKPSLWWVFAKFFDTKCQQLFNFHSQEVIFGHKWLCSFVYLKPDFLGFFQQSYSECVHSKWESSAHVWTRVHEDLVLCSLCPPWVAQKALHSQINPSASMSHECNFACGQEVKQHISVKSSLWPGFRPHSHAQNPTELCFPLCAGLSSTFKKQGYVSFALSTCK